MITSASALIAADRIRQALGRPHNANSGIELRLIASIISLAVEQDEKAQRVPANVVPITGRVRA